MRRVIAGLFFFFLFLSFISEAYSQSYVPEWNNAKIKVKPVVTIKVYAFDLRNVTLLPGYFMDAMNADVTYLLKLEPDRLLSDFRKHAGLIPKGERYGGWESSGLAGHTLGHYLSALSMYYASSGDKEFLRRVNYIVDQLDECQKARKTGYVGAIPNEDSMWAQVKSGNIRSRGFDLNGAWSPWYTVHKIMGGLLDAYLYCDNKKALQVEKAIADWTGNIIGGLSDSLMQKMLITEYGGMNDVLINTYALTGNKKYLGLSNRFYDRRILDSLANKKDVLPGKHSNTQIPKIIGLARSYQLTGNKKDSTIAGFFWSTVTGHHSYATGGNSNYEYFGPADELNDKLSDNTTETCNTYNMLKLTSELFAGNPSGALMDYYEKALYNHILASQNHETGMVTYFVSLRMGGSKEFSDEYNSFTCCVGTGMENHVKYNENIYYRAADGGLYINLFIPSVLNWKEKGIVLKQESEIPTTDKSVFTISAKKPSTFALRIRKPSWSQNLSVSINGIVQTNVTTEDGYIVIKRIWNNNDRIELITPMKFHTQAMPDNANRRAVFYGPVLLAGVFGDKEPEPSEIPVFVTTNNDPDTWINRGNTNELIFQTKDGVATEKINLIPFNRILNQHYTVYWDVFTPDEWKIQEKKYQEENAKKKKIEMLTVDILRMGEMQPERDHELTGDKIFTSDDHNRKWRIAGQGGYIKFKMKTDPDSANTLILTYWGMDNRDRIFDIYFNDAKIATEDLNKYKQSRFYDIPYLIPGGLTKNKPEGIIKLVPHERNSAGPVYGARIVKGDTKNIMATD